MRVKMVTLDAEQERAVTGFLLWFRRHSAVDSTTTRLVRQMAKRGTLAEHWQHLRFKYEPN